MIDTAAIVEALELLESQDATAARLDAALREVVKAEDLWRIAEGTVAYPAIMGAIYRRAVELDFSHERAVGYLSLSHSLAGDSFAATSLLGRLPETSYDEVVLSSWALLADTPQESITRLRIATVRCPMSLRLWRQIADVAGREGLESDTRQALFTLRTLETSEEQRRRVERLLQREGWLDP